MRRQLGKLDDILYSLGPLLYEHIKAWEHCRGGIA